MKWPPHITVATVVQKADRFLMVSEMDGGNTVVNQPAGHLDPGETLFEAAIRETLEESGWKVELTSLVGLYMYHSPHNQIIYHRICFAADPIEHITSELDNDILEANWMTIEEIHQVPQRSPLVLKCIEDHLAGPSAPLTMVQHFV